MNKKTQMWIGVVALAGAAYFLYNKNKKEKVFANLRGGGFSAPTPGCQIYEGSCNTGGTSGNASVGTIIQGWSGGTDGIIVANSSTRCIVCPKSDTPTGLPLPSDK
jgi:hypothetical protein